MDGLKLKDKANVYNGIETFNRSARNFAMFETSGYAPPLFRHRPLNG